MSHWGVVIEQLTHEDDDARRYRLRRAAARRGRRRWAFRSPWQPVPKRRGRVANLPGRAIPRLGRG